MADEFFKPAVIKKLRTYMIVPGTKIPVSKVIETLGDPNSSYDALVKKYPALNKISQDEIFVYTAKALHIIEDFLKEQKDKFVKDQLEKAGLPQDDVPEKKKKDTVASSSGAASSSSSSASTASKSPAAEKIPLDMKGDIYEVEHVNIYIDGGALNNPGPAAIGVVFKDNAGNILHTFNQYIGETTNNVAEYKALICGLSLALNFKKDKLTVFSDSQLLVNQMNGAYKIKQEHLLELAIKATELKRKFKKVRIVNIPREQNKEADKLVGLILKDKKK